MRPAKGGMLAAEPPNHAVHNDAGVMQEGGTGTGAAGGGSGGNSGDAHGGSGEPAAAQDVTLGPLSMRFDQRQLACSLDHDGLEMPQSLDDFWIVAKGPSVRLFLVNMRHGDPAACEGFKPYDRKQAQDEGGFCVAVAKTTPGSPWWTIGRLLAAGTVSAEVVSVALVHSVPVIQPIYRPNPDPTVWGYVTDNVEKETAAYIALSLRDKHWKWQVDVRLRVPAAMFQDGPPIGAPLADAPPADGSAEPDPGQLPHEAVLAALHPPQPELSADAATVLDFFDALYQLRALTTPKGGDPDAARWQKQRGFRERILRIVQPTDWTAEEQDPEGLRCILYSYQRRALSWMLWRERRGYERAAALNLTAPASSKGSRGSTGSRGGGSNRGGRSAAAADGAATAAGGAQPAAAGGAAPEGVWSRHDVEGGAPQTSQLPALDAAVWPLWRRLRDPASGMLFFLDPATGAVRQSPPEDVPPSAAGGLLCEEMGLGKTVEIIALILARPRPSLPPGTDAVEVVKRAAGAASSALSFKCKGWGGTLVVSPTPIHGQWLGELQQHSGLRVEVYYGLTWHRTAGAGPSRNRQTPQDQWEALKHLVAGNAPLAYNADGEAAAIVARLMEADVVLTTYQVLQAEVNYSDPEGAGFGMAVAERKLRHPKKYRVPVSPLLAVPWWRVAFDEAQMVAMETREVTRMANRIRAAHRWAVTGTPLGPHCLADLYGLLQVIDAPGWRLERTWHQCVEQPLFVDDDTEALAAAVRPLMWRNTKALVALEGTTLPPRTLQEVRLHFTPAEATFYGTIRDDGRKARNQLQALLLQGGHTEYRERAARRKAEAEARRVMEQLRLACLHPQMTQYWRGLANELQLAQGGTLSMAEIMGRMAEQKQGAVQAAERKLCERLNKLAAALTAQADDANASRGLPVTPRGAYADAAAPNTGAGSDDDPDDAGPSSGRRRGRAPKRKRKTADADAEPASPRSPSGKKRKLLSEAEAVAAREEALQALTTARRVTEKGIDAFDASRELDSLPEPAPAAGASIHAWRLIEVKTAHQLQAAHALAGRTSEAAAMAQLVGRKMADITEAADEKLARAQSRLTERERQSLQAQAAVSAAWGRAEALGVEAALLGDAAAPAPWLAATAEAFAAAQAREVEQRETLETRAGNTHVALLGTQVEQFVAAAGKPLEAPARGLDAALHAPHLEAAAADVSRVVSALSKRPREEDGAWAAGDAAGGLQGAAAAPPPLPPGKRDWQDYLVELTLQFKLTGPEGSVALAQRIRSACDPLVTSQILRGVQTQQRTLVRQSQAQAAAAAAYFDACGAGVPAHETPAEQVGAAAAVFASRQAALRALRELHRAQLQVEVESEAQAAVMAEARLAAAGGDSATRHKPEFLRKEVAKAAEDARKLASERRFIEARRDEADGATAAAGSPATLQQNLQGGPQPQQPQQQQQAQPGQHAEAGPSAATERTGGGTAPARRQDADTAAVASPLALQLPEEPDPMSPGAPAVPPADTAAASDGGAPAGSLLSPRATPPRQGAAAAAAASGPLAAGSQAPPGSLMTAGGVAVKRESGAVFQSSSPLTPGTATAPVLDTPGMLHASKPSPDAAAATGAVTTGQGPAAPAAGPQLRLDDLMLLSGAPAPAAAAATATAAAPTAGPPEASHAAAEAGQCPICLEDLAGLTLHVYPCGHTFCEACSTKVFESHAAAAHAGDRASVKVGCPLCKRPVKWDGIFRAASAAQATPWQLGGAIPDVDPDDPGIADVRLRGAWMTKLEAALRRVLRGRLIHPGDKWLVFSAFPDALGMLGKALAANGVQAAQLKGNRETIAKALAAFNGDPEVAVMLMPAKTAAAGLTLTAANRVILLEPAADPAIPQQAVARVHRVGQIKPVTVYQLMVADTVEEPLWRMQQDRQHLFGGEQGAEEDDDDEVAVDTFELPPPPANPQALRPEDLQRLLESIMDLDDAHASDGGGGGGTGGGGGGGARSTAGAAAATAGNGAAGTGVSMRAAKTGNDSSSSDGGGGSGGPAAGASAGPSRQADSDGDAGGSSDSGNGGGSEGDDAPPRPHHGGFMMTMEALPGGGMSFHRSGCADSRDDGYFDPNGDSDDEHGDSDDEDEYIDGYTSFHDDSDGVTSSDAGSGGGAAAAAAGDDAPAGAVSDDDGTIDLCSDSGTSSGGGVVTLD